VIFYFVFRQRSVLCKRLPQSSICGHDSRNDKLPGPCHQFRCGSLGRCKHATERTP